jgi:RNA polymerase sigma-70 factor (ECF subfamily)
MAAINTEQLIKWYKTCGAELMLYARHLTGGQSAEDIVQDAFVKLMRQRVCPNNVRAWLFRVVRNASISSIRRLRIKRLFCQTLTADSQSWFQSCADDLIDAQQLQSLLETLSPSLREVVLLRIWGQMSLKEVAQVMKKPVSTVHHMYQTALETLRRKLEHASCTTKTS